MHPYRVLRLIQEHHADLIEKRQRCNLEFQRQIDQNEMDQALVLRWLGREPGIYTSLVLHQAGYVDEMCRLTPSGNKRITELCQQYDPAPQSIEAKESTHA